MRYTREALERLGVLLEQKIKQQLKVQDLYATGNLYNSVHYIAFRDGTSATLNIYADKSAKIVNEGRNPQKRQPPSGPTSALYKWAKAKGIQPRVYSQRNGRRVSQFGSMKGFEQMVFNIARAIGQKGTIKRYNYSGAKFLDYVIDATAIKITEEIQKGYTKDLESEININGNS